MPPKIQTSALRAAQPLGNSGFVEPDWARSLDVDAQLAGVPAAARVKGMFWADLQRIAAAFPGLLPAVKYNSFTDYALVDYMAAVVKVARATHPTATTSEAIRRIGQRGFAVLASSLAGKVLFAFAGRDLAAALGLVSEAYRRCLTPGDARVVSHQHGRMIIELREVWNFVEAYQVGVFEGAIQHFGHTGTVKVRALSACDADYLVEWH